MSKRKRRLEDSDDPLSSDHPASTPKKQKNGLVNSASKSKREELNGEYWTAATSSRSSRSARVTSATKPTSVSEGVPTPTPTKGRKGVINGIAADEGDDTLTTSTPAATPSKSTSRRGRPSSTTKLTSIAGSYLNNDAPRNGKRLFTTPTKKSTEESRVTTTPSTAHNADRSARRKSARTIQEQEDAVEDAWDADNTLARQIRNGEDVIEGEEDDQEHGSAASEAVEPTSSQPTTPSKRRGPRRLPTPEGDLPPQERYFFQNRPGSGKTSNNSLPSSSLLTHEEYFEQIRKYKDPHEPEKAFLLDLHARSFPQWQFEFYQRFNICIYGWGSKRKLVKRFAEWLYPKIELGGKIVIVNGYAPNVTVKSIFTTIMTAGLGSEVPSKLPSNPSDLLATLLSSLSTNPPPHPVTLIINSVDALPLRNRTTQFLLARIASCPHINLLATADTPNFTLLWDTTLRSQFNFVFHDCTTFTPYDTEISVVDDVHDLLGRSGRRVGGKDGIGFVLKSLPENARNLYRVLITETLTAMTEGVEHDHEAERAPNAEDVGVEYRHLYAKAAEEFICSSEMAFRTLLKEFHDHQMVVSRKDMGGTEVLSLPLGREEMEGVLEDLVVG